MKIWIGLAFVAFSLPASAQDNERVSLAPGTGTIIVTTEEPGAEVSIDGRDVGTTPLTEPIRVVAGTHLVEVNSAGYQTWQWEGEVPENDQMLIEANLELSTENLARRGRSRGFIIGGSVTVGLSVVLLGATLGLYSVNSGRVDDYEAEEVLLESQWAAHPDDRSLSEDDLNQRQRDNEELAVTIEEWTTIEWALAGTGFAFLAAALAFYIAAPIVGRNREAARRSGRSLALLPSPGGFALQW